MDNLEAVVEAFLLSKRTGTDLKIVLKNMGLTKRDVKKCMELVNHLEFIYAYEGNEENFRRSFANFKSSMEAQTK